MKPPSQIQATQPPDRIIPTLRRRLLAWYQDHQRDLPWRQTRDPYRIWISEAMLQQTQVATVIPYYHRFLKRFPDLPTLARADMQEILKLWEGLGYYRRAHNLHKAVRTLMQTGAGRIPKQRKPFLALPGVGDYIANAVMSIAFDLPYAVVDGNVKRVLSRLAGIADAVNHPPSHRIYQEAADRLLDCRNAGRFNQALMELGALVCTPRTPNCTVCPWEAHCFARKHDATGDFPKRIRKAPTPDHAMVAGALCHRNRLLIVQRPSEGLLAGLWEFPGGRRKDGEHVSAACKRILDRTTSLAVSVDDKLIRLKHAYTHFRITLDLFWCHKMGGRVRLNGYQAFRWIRLDELDAFPFTGVCRKALPHLPADNRVRCPPIRRRHSPGIESK
jgi:A/G-specific adenine glycosylase